MIFDKHAYCHVTCFKGGQTYKLEFKAHGKFAYCLLLIAHCLLPIAHCALPFVLSVFCTQRRKGKLRKAAKKTSTNNLPLACCLMLIADCRLPIARCRLPIANCLLLNIHCLLLIALCPKRILHAKTQRKTTQSRKEDIYK